MSRDGMVAVSVISLSPVYDSIYESDLSDLSNKLLSFSQQATPPLLIIDLPHTKFFGSAFLGLLIKVSNALQARDGRLALSRLSTYCRVAVEKSKLDTVFNIYDSIEAAVNDFQN